MRWFSTCAEDCNDNDPFTYPGAAENISLIHMTDRDEDGFERVPSDGALGGTDCDDTNDNFFFMGAAQIEGLAQCMQDVNDDGYGDLPPLGVTAGTDCDDDKANLPGNDFDGFSTCDDDCDDTDPAEETTDEDGDGNSREANAADDCDDEDQQDFPTAEIRNDGTDQNCDGYDYMPSQMQRLVDITLVDTLQVFGMLRKRHQVNPLLKLVICRYCS